jgi:putative flippase GtrA
LVHWFHAAPGTNNLKNQFLRFTLVGTVATVTTYAVLIVGVEGLHINAVMASVAGYVLGIVVNYILNYRYTFGSDQRHHVVIPKFLAVMVVGMFMNAAVMFAGINWLDLHYMLAQLVAVAVVLMLSFTANRLWAFAD